MKYRDDDLFLSIIRNLPELFLVEGDELAIDGVVFLHWINMLRGRLWCDDIVWSKRRRRSKIVIYDYTAIKNINIWK